jgi:cytochrome P450
MSMLAAPPRNSDLRPVGGDRGLPYVGRILAGKRDPVGLARSRYDKFGPVSWSNGLGHKMVSLLGPEAVGVGLANLDKAFGNGPGWSFFIGPFFHRGIMLMDGAEHLHHRRIMQQAFTQAKLEAYLEPMNAVVAEAVSQWRASNDFRIFPAIRDLTLDLAFDVFMGGAEFGSHKAEVNRAFVDCIKGGSALLRFPAPGGNWRAGLEGRKVLEKFLYDRIQDHRAGDGGDLFTALCQAKSEDGHSFTDADVVNHMIFLLMAAHDTTTITLSTMISYLGQHEDWRQRCRDETPDKPALSFADLAGYAGVDMVMKESNRLVTPVPLLLRKTVLDTEVLGQFIPRDTFVQLGTHFTHHMHEYWPDPERFDPGRFSPERREDKVHRYAFVPFGGGVHKCIGMHFASMQVKAIMHQVCRRFDWTVPADYTAPMDFTALPKPTDGLPINLTLR